MQNVALVYVKGDEESYNRKLQLNAIKESIIPDYDYEIECEEDLKEAFDTALSRGVDSITTVLPEKLIESKILSTYKNKFENFEVIKETFYRLDEAEGFVQSNQQQPIKQNYKKPAFGQHARNVLIWPVNPPFVSAAAKKNFQTILPYLGKMFTEDHIFVYVPSNGVNGNWCINAPNCCARIEDFKQLSSKLTFSNYKIITSVRAFVQNIQQNKLGNKEVQSSENVATNATVDTTLDSTNIYCQPMYAKHFIAAGFNHVYTSIGNTPLVDDNLSASQKVYKDWVAFEKKYKLSNTGKKEVKAAKQNAEKGQQAVANAEPQKVKESLLFENIIREANGQAPQQQDASSGSAWDWEQIKNKKGAVWFLTEILTNISTCAKGLGDAVMDGKQAGNFLKGIRDQYIKELSDMSTEAANLTARSLGLGFVADVAAKTAKAYAERDRENEKQNVGAIGAFIKSKDSETLRSLLEKPEKYIERAGDN